MGIVLYKNLPVSLIGEAKLREALWSGAARGRTPKRNLGFAYKRNKLCINYAHSGGDISCTVLLRSLCLLFFCHFFTNSNDG